jgi:hypothetical protein
MYQINPPGPLATLSFPREKSLLTEVKCGTGRSGRGQI